MLGYLYLQSLGECLRLRRLAPWLGLALVCFLMGLLWRTLMPEASPVQRYADVSSLMVFRILALASTIYATTIIGQEVEQGTIVYLLTRTVPRWMILLARHLASVTVVAAVGLLSALLLSVAVFGNPALNPVLGSDCLALVLAAFAYGGLFLFVSLLFNRAMLICLLFAFGWESSVAIMPGKLYRLSVFSYMQAIGDHPVWPEKQQVFIKMITGALSQNDLSRSVAIGSLIASSIVFAALSAYWFTNFEFVPREDAA